MGEGGVFLSSDSFKSDLAQNTPLSFFFQLETLMLAIEREIALLEHFSPRNFREQVTRLSEIFARGDAERPQFVYVAASSRLIHADAQLRFVDDQLVAIASDSRWGWLSNLMRKRLVELSLELELVNARETPDVIPLVRKRFPLTAEERQAGVLLAERWLDEASVETVTSDEQVGIAAAFLEQARAEGLDIPILERELASIAAVGGHCIYVQKNARVSRSEAARLWVHEVGAHLRPRLLAQGPPFRIGTSQANEDEEGRAVLLEGRAALLSPQRKRELATRHLLASAAREFPERVFVVARELLERGVPASLIANAVCRVSRGGGLAREVIYLASFVRVSEELRKLPELEDWMKLGRISVAGAHVLRRHGSTISQNQ